MNAEPEKMQPSTGQSLQVDNGASMPIDILQWQSEINSFIEESGNELAQIVEQLEDFGAPSNPSSAMNAGKEYSQKTPKSTHNPDPIHPSVERTEHETSGAELANPNRNQYFDFDSKKTATETYDNTPSIDPNERLNQLKSRLANRLKK